jgi:hypothetical protein
MVAQRDHGQADHLLASTQLLKVQLALALVHAAMIPYRQPIERS